MMLIFYTLLLFPFVGLALHRVVQRRLIRIEKPTWKGVSS